MAKLRSVLEEIAKLELDQSQEDSKTEQDTRPLWLQILAIQTSSGVRVAQHAVGDE